MHIDLVIGATNPLLRRSSFASTSPSNCSYLSSFIFVGCDVTAIARPSNPATPDLTNAKELGSGVSESYVLPRPLKREKLNIVTDGSAGRSEIKERLLVKASADV